MSVLTRRRSDNPGQENWNVYFGDAHVGSIGDRAVDVDQWGEHDLYRSRPVAPA